LTWEERKTQEKINIWAKRKSKGEDIKIGFGKIQIKNIWRYWTDIEKEITARENDIEKEGGRIGEVDRSKNNRLKMGENFA